MQDTTRQSSLADGEINLTGLWSVLVRRKKLVLIIPVLLLLVAALYLRLTPAVFESRAIIQVGQVMQVGQIEAPAALVWRLKEQYRVDNKDQVAEMPWVLEISIDKKGPGNVVSFLAQDHSAQSAQKHLTHVMQALLSEHTKLYNQSMGVPLQRLQFLCEQKQTLNDNIKELSTHIEAVRNKDPVQAIILGIEKRSLLLEAARLDADCAALQLSTSDIRSQPTKLLLEPTLPHSPSTPKSKLILKLALVLGVMLGIVAAFTSEFLAKAR